LNRKLVVCIQQRYAPNPVCCTNNGSRELLPLLQQAISELKVDVELETSGCLGMCLQGPNFKLFPEGQVWNGVKKTDVAEIVRQVGALAVNK
jgi:(2Fe-2S) ferredoxin